MKIKKPLPEILRVQTRPTIATVVRDGGLLFRSAAPLPRIAPFRKPN